MLNIDCCEAGQNRATNQQKKTAEKAAKHLFQVLF